MVAVLGAGSFGLAGADYLWSDDMKQILFIIVATAGIFATAFFSYRSGFDAGADVNRCVQAIALLGEAEAFGDGFCDDAQAHGQSILFNVLAWSRQ